MQKLFNNIKLQKSVQLSRKIGINSLSVLSHHRAYRSVHGGSLIYTKLNEISSTSTYPFPLFPDNHT